MVNNAIGESSFLTNSEMDRLLKLMYETRDASLVMLPPPAADGAPISDAEIKSWYDGHAAAYRAPETVTLEYVEINAADLPLPALDEAALRARYEQEKKQFVEQEQRLASHILISVDAKADAAAQKAPKPRPSSSLPRPRHRVPTSPHWRRPTATTRVPKPTAATWAGMQRA